MKLPITQIVQGPVNDLVGLNEDLSQRRLNICKKCPIYTVEYGGLCDNTLWLNPDTDEISTEPLDGYVQGCGCVLQRKVQFANARCVVNKW